MKPTYYSAAWTDSGFLLGCPHEHETLVGAISCIPCAGGYVVGIKNGVVRSLTHTEESEFQAVTRDPFKYPPPYSAAPAAGSPAKASTDPGYTVMTRIKLVDHWSWSTWMCFDTYEQAVAHARKGDKVVRFCSEEWAALKQQKWTEPPQTDPDYPVHSDGVKGSLPSRAGGEPLVQFVLRLLTTLDPVGFPSHECQEECPVTSESDKRTSQTETPTHIARMILSRLSNSEIRKLEVLSQTDIPALLEALQRRLPTVSNDSWGQ